MRCFVLMTDPLTRAQEEALLEKVIQANGMGWMHYLPGSWLIADAAERQTAAAISDLMASTFPDTRCIVLEVHPGTWAVRMDTEYLPQIRDWFESSWRNGPPMQHPTSLIPSPKPR